MRALLAWPAQDTPSNRRTPTSFLRRRRTAAFTKLLSSNIHLPRARRQPAITSPRRATESTCGYDAPRLMPGCQNAPVCCMASSPPFTRALRLRGLFERGASRRREASRRRLMTLRRNAMPGFACRARDLFLYSPLRYGDTICKFDYALSAHHALFRPKNGATIYFSRTQRARVSVGLILSASVAAVNAAAVPPFRLSKSRFVTRLFRSLQVRLFPKCP